VPAVASVLAAVAAVTAVVAAVFASIASAVHAMRHDCGASDRGHGPSPAPG
jgi:hypothetical protein